MSKIMDILKLDIPGTGKSRPRDPRLRSRIDLAIVLMVIGGPVGLLFYLTIYKSMQRRRAYQLYTRLRMIVQNNAPLSEGLMQIAMDSKTGIAEILGGLAHEIENGATLSDALSLYPSVFAARHRAQIRIGESTGQLGDALNSVLESCDRDRETRTVSFINVSYIFIVFTAQTLIITFILIRVVPVFEEIMDDFVDTLSNNSIVQASTLPYRLLTMTSPPTALSVMWIVIAALILIFVLTRFRFGQFLICPILYRIPVLGRVFRLRQQSQVIRAFELLVKADVPMPEALERLQHLDITVPFRRALRRVHRRIENGSDLTDAWTPARHLFTRDFIASMSLGDYAGTLPNSCAYIRATTNRNLLKRTRQLTDSMIPAYAVICGAINLWLVLIVHGFIVQIAEVMILH